LPDLESEPDAREMPKFRFFFLSLRSLFLSHSSSLPPSSPPLADFNCAIHPIHQVLLPSPDPSPPLITQHPTTRPRPAQKCTSTPNSSTTKTYAPAQKQPILHLHHHHHSHSSSQSQS